MARIYKDEPSLFWPIQIVVDPFCSRPKECLNEEELIEEQKVVQQKKIDVALIKRGYTHIQEKIKEIRQKFSEAVTSGQRSGSGKIVLEFYDQLVQLWGGSPATEPLPSGVSTHGIDKGLPTNAVVDGGGNIDEELGTTLQEDGMSTAILKVAEGLSKSIEMMATSMLQPQQQLAQPYNIQPQYGHFQHVNNYMGSSGLQYDFQMSKGKWIAVRNLVWNEEKFKEGLEYVKFLHGVDSLVDDQAVPAIADYLQDNLAFTSCVLVVSLLQSLMLDQVSKLKKAGINAAVIYSEQKEDVFQEIEDGGFYNVLFTSPESMLATDRCRTFLSSNAFLDHWVCVAFDEAHCIAQWVVLDLNKHWLSGNGMVKLEKSEKSVKLAVFTATATKSTKAAIISALNLAPVSTSVFEKSPIKSNLLFFTTYVGNDTKFEVVFSELINELVTKGKKTKRRIIFCQSRNQTALIWKMFELKLGKAFYADDSDDPRCRIMEMFHAGTPSSVKEHVLDEIGSGDSCLRVLVVTTAFGMGVDCKQVHRVIHFGPSNSIEAYLQECGKAGRYEVNSHCYLLYNGFLTSHCQTDIKEYVAGDQCRRKFIEGHFPGNHPVSTTGCVCCDVCLSKCECVHPCSSSVLQFSKSETASLEART
eukprot:gene4367-4948_t